MIYKVNKEMILEGFGDGVKDWMNKNVLGKTKENGYDTNGNYNKENDQGYQKYMNGPSTGDLDRNGDPIVAHKPFEENSGMSYDEGVLKKLKSLGLGQLEQREKVEKDMQAAVKKVDVDNSNPEVEYSKTIYDNDELKDLENPKENKDIKAPKGHEITK